jgi:tRNA pseudouridine65 synthase
MLTILYQDEHLAAVHKPPGLLVHRTGLDAGETRFALQMLRDQLGQMVWPAHRLDKGTSGVLLFALSAEAARAVGMQFDAGTVRKTYRAMVRGWPQSEGVIDHPLRRMDGFGGMGSVSEAQEARTRYTRLTHYELPLPDREFASTRCALMELTPDTGRQHQLRRHCKHMAHAIVGDATHGKGAVNRAVAGLLGVNRLWLLAQELQLQHPATSAPLVVRAHEENEWILWNRYIFNS